MTNLIGGLYDFETGLNRSRADYALDEDDKTRIENLLVGNSVEKVAEDHLLLSDGTLLKFVGNVGGCLCGAGDYDLTVLNGVENIITAVTFEDNPAGDDYKSWMGYYRIFVFADNQQINLATFEGSDGNGYYGTGYNILVRKTEEGDPAQP